MKINIRASYDSFRELRENNSYYIDKTDLIEEFLIDKFDKAVLFARPRRFGKTLTMTMLRDFLDIRQESRDIFCGLKVIDNAVLVENYMNKYPVVFISLKEVFGENFKSIFSSLRIAVSNLCEENRFLVEENNTNISETSKSLFANLWNRRAEQPDTEQALGLLCQMLRSYYKQKVFVIIDEYDVPMAKALGSPEYDKVRDMIEHMLSYVCKTNENVKGVILSGCLYTVKNSTYTGVNNIIPYTVLSPNFASSIGFTDDNVKKLLEDAGLSDRYDTVSEWYDGYIFGREKMYCPWDVLLYVRSVLDGSYSEIMGPESYWVNTSYTTQNLIHGFLGKTSEVNEKFEKLLAGETVKCFANEHVPYHLIHENGDNLWSALLETGYLSKATEERMKVMPLRIPNKEIKEVFRQEVWNYFNTKINNEFVNNLIDSLWAESTESAKASMNQILEATLSFYHEYHEYSYHLILDGFFTGLGYMVDSERESGYGRTDLIIRDTVRKCCLILELKHVKEEAEMENALKEAKSQIVRNKYESRFEYEGYTTRLQYGMVFWGKKCIIGKVAGN
ncbi:MAG: AAA family ATPase [Oscillospiraceae bacterium]|nr:AAA family ATPase [Oscillospiraceae bacterium]